MQVNPRAALSVAGYSEFSFFQSSADGYIEQVEDIAQSEPSGIVSLVRLLKHVVECL